MLTFGLNYDVKPGREADFEAYSAAVLEAVKGVPGHQETRLYVDVNKVGSYMIYSNWETREAFMAFISSQAFKDAQQGGADMLSGPPRHSVYNREQMMGGPPPGAGGPPPASH
ncbi:MAG: antibiotic biosynthesis monooxygenase [bacterium]